MASSRGARGLGYGSVGGAPFGDDDRVLGGGGAGGLSAVESRRQQQWPWLRVGIASIAVVATLGLLSASRLASYPSVSSTAGSTAYTSVDSSSAAAANLAENTATAAGGREDAPAVSGTATASASSGPGGDAQELSFVAENEYTRRGDVIGLGYPWLQVCSLPYYTSLCTTLQCNEAAVSNRLDQQVDMICIRIPYRLLYIYIHEVACR